MKVEYLFSNNNKLGSKIIQWASKKEKIPMENLPSHVAVLIDNKLVIESTLSTGVRIIPYFKWKKINNEIAKIPCKKDYKSPKEIFKAFIILWGMKYDWLGILYFAKCLLLMIIFKKELPKRNKWEHKNKYFCTEFVARLTNIDCSMKTPAKLLHEWTRNPQED